MDSSPAKSTAGDGLRERDNALFRDFYFALIKHFKPLLSDSRIEGVCFDKLYIFDSTTISLFSDIMKGVGRNPKGDGKKKEGLKVHMMTDAHSDTAQYAVISEARLHDKNFLKHLILPSGSMIVFDKAYNHYYQFAEWTKEGVNFVCRLKDNALYEVVETMFEKTLTGKEHGIMKDEHIHIKYKDAKQEKTNAKKQKQKLKTLCLRKVTYRDKQKRVFQFITNNFEISADEVAFLYKKRWSIELLKN